MTARQNNPSLFIVAGIVMVLVAGFVVAWAAQFIYLYSIPGDTVDMTLPEGFQRSFNAKLRYLLYFQVFGFLWTTAFLSGVFQVSIAGGIASWYFSRSNHDGTSDVGSPALITLARAFTLSFGSIAFGSLILAVVEFLNFLLNQSKKANKYNKVVAFILSCVQCLLACCASIIKFINRFTYIYIAMHGDSFCPSAKNCFNLISRNTLSVVVLDYLGDFVLFIGKLLGAAGTLLITMGIVHSVGREVSYVTVVVVAVVAYIIFSIFSKILSMGASTVFVCYMEDLERNADGTLNISPDLHKKFQSRSREIDEKASCC